MLLLMARSERRLVVLLLVLAALGHVAKLVLQRPEEAPGAIRLIQEPSAAGALAAQRALVERVARPLALGERVDADQASAVELARLPGVGPVLAKRIVAERARSGPFGGLEGLDRVSGIGPALLAQVEPYVAFSAPPVPAAASVVGSLAHDSAAIGLVAINQASAKELESLPGIGPVKARDIVAYRELHGPFATLEQLALVRGIGPAMLARLRPLVMVP